MQERGVVKLWEVAMFNCLLPHIEVLANEC